VIEIGEKMIGYIKERETPNQNGKLRSIVEIYFDKISV